MYEGGERTERENGNEHGKSTRRIATLGVYEREKKGEVRWMKVYLAEMCSGKLSEFYCEMILNFHELLLLF